MYIITALLSVSGVPQDEMMKAQDLEAVVITAKIYYKQHSKNIQLDGSVKEKGIGGDWRNPYAGFLCFPFPAQEETLSVLLSPGRKMKPFRKTHLRLRS